MLCEGIEARLAFAGLGGKVTWYALDSEGKRTEEVPVIENESGEALLEINPGYRTLWYEVIVEERNQTKQ